MGETGTRGSTHPARAPSQLFHWEMMLLASFREAEGSKGRAESAAGPQEPPQSSQHQELDAQGWSRAGQSRWLQSALETRGFQTAASFPAPITISWAFCPHPGQIAGRAESKQANELF